MKSRKYKTDHNDPNCNKCIHKNVCFDFWQSDMVCCEEERSIESMNESWSINCDNYEMYIK